MLCLNVQMDLPKLPYDRALLHISLAFGYPCVETSRMLILEQGKDAKQVRDCIRDRWCDELRKHNNTTTLLGSS